MIVGAGGVGSKLEVVARIALSAVNFCEPRAWCGDSLWYPASSSAFVLDAIEDSLRGAQDEL